MPIDAVPDHVAVAVPDIDTAAARWVDELHGTWVGDTWTAPHFVTRQLRYRGSGKLELLAPASPDGFAAAFLARFGARIHHLTVTVPDLEVALATLAEAGYDAVDVSYERDDWHEAFLRPSTVGGIIVQVARTPYDDAAWADLEGRTLVDVDERSPRLLGPTLTHTDLEAASRVWTTLGAELTWWGDDTFEARWGDAPLTVRVERDVGAGPRGLRFDPDPGLPDDDLAGSGTLQG